MNEILYIGGSGTVYAMRAKDCSVLWCVELQTSWLLAGSAFVSLRETDTHLFAFAYGTLYKIDKASGHILQKGGQIKALKSRAGVFSTSTDSDFSSCDDAALAGDDGCGDGGCDGGDGGD